MQDFNALITAPVGTNSAARTDTIDPRISIALDIISRVCDDQENLVQDILREEQGHKVCFKISLLKATVLIFVHACCSQISSVQILHRNQALLLN